ncbi:MAG: hypothetical protein WCE75_16960 [Terracidiphilus sp.]
MDNSNWGTVTPANNTPYATGAQVTITATANPGYQFTGWTGSSVSSNNVQNPASPSTQLTMQGSNQDQVQANFAPMGPLTTPVGQTSATATATLTFTTAGTPGAINVVTQGAANLDFQSASGGNCSTGTAYAVGQSCTVNYTFAPLAPGLRMGAVELFDGSGNLLASGPISGMGQGPVIAYGPGTQSTVSFNGLSDATRVAVDAAGDLFASTKNNSQVVKLMPGGVQTTVFSGFGGIPHALAVDGAGKLYVQDSWQGLLWKVTPSGASSTVPYGGTNPASVAADGSGNLFVVDTNQVLELIPAGVQTTVPTSGLSSPQALALDAAGDLFISDTGNNQAVEVPAGGGAQTTVASGLSNPSAIAVDAAGDRPLHRGIRYFRPRGRPGRLHQRRLPDHTGGRNGIPEPDCSGWIR